DPHRRPRLARWVARRGRAACVMPPARPRGCGSARLLDDRHPGDLDRRVRLPGRTGGAHRGAHDGRRPPRVAAARARDVRAVRERGTRCLQPGAGRAVARDQPVVAVVVVCDRIAFTATSVASNTWSVGGADTFTALP